MSEASQRPGAEAEPEDAPAPRTWPQALREELREHPMAYFVLFLFVISGPIVTHLLFPGAPAGVGIVGGAALGAYAALCAMPGRLL